MSYQEFDPIPVYRHYKRLIGTGKVGGKAKGLAFAHTIITGSTFESFVDLPPINYVITTDIFQEFVEDNLIKKILADAIDAAPESSEEDGAEYIFAVVSEAFRNGKVRESYKKNLISVIEEIGDIPLAIRSSSLLEDSKKLSFAGKYGTRFSANTGSIEERYEKIELAIREVWASLYNPAARAYRKKHGFCDENEAMAVIIQPVMGKPHGNMFYPEIAGTVFSKVYRRPSTRIKKDDGIMRYCFGMGTRTVDRAKACQVFLSHPSLRPQGNQPEDIAQTSQIEFDFVDRNRGEFTTANVGDHLSFILKEHPMASSFIEIYCDNLLYWAGSSLGRKDGLPLFTFSSFPQRHPKFFSRMKDLAHFLEESMGMPVDFEFTYDTASEQLFIVQLRPLAAYEEMAKVRIPEVREDQIILRGNRMVSNGRLEHIKHIVYVDPYLYGKDDTFYQVAREIGRINEKLAGTNYILVGPGRWGSSNPKLGTPVRYNEICNCGCLIEVGITEKNYTPELSYGTHFFLDLDNDGILYLPVFSGFKDNIFNHEWFNTAPYEQKRHPAVRFYTGDFSVFLDGDKEKGVIIVNE